MEQKILIIDDEQPIIDAVETIMGDMGYDVQGFTDASAGIQAAIDIDFDLILVDVRMPEKNGAEVTAAIIEAKPEAKILIITAFPTDPFAKQALDAGAKTIIKKPFEIGKVLDYLRN